MANGGDNDLPKFLSGALKVLAGAAGASAVFGGLATFIGLQYQRAFYEKLGVPFSELSFSTQDYVFATKETATLAFYVFALALVGLAFGMLWPATAPTLRVLIGQARDALGEDIKALVKPNDAVAKGGLAILGFNILVPLGIVALFIVGIFYLEGTNVGLRILVVGVFALVSAYLVASFFKSSARPSYLAVGFIGFAILLSLGLVYGPTWVAKEKATQISKHADDFPLGTFVTKGANGIPREAPVSSQIRKCEEYMEGDNAPTPSLCHAFAVVVIHNNGAYFVRDACTFSSTQNRVYRIEDKRVVRVAFQAEWLNRVPVNCPTYTPTFTPSRTPTVTPTHTDTPTHTATPTDTPTAAPTDTSTPSTKPSPGETSAGTP